MFWLSDSIKNEEGEEELEISVIIKKQTSIWRLVLSIFSIICLLVWFQFLIGLTCVCSFHDLVDQTQYCEVGTREENLLLLQEQTEQLSKGNLGEFTCISPHAFSLRVYDGIRNFYNYIFEWSNLKDTFRAEDLILLHKLDAIHLDLLDRFTKPVDISFPSGDLLQILGGTIAFLGWLAYFRLYCILFNWIMNPKDQVVEEFFVSKFIPRFNFGFPSELLLLMTYELLEIVIQCIYLYSISTGLYVKEDIFIRTQAWLIFLNIAFTSSWYLLLIYCKMSVERQLIPLRMCDMLFDIAFTVSPILLSFRNDQYFKVGVVSALQIKSPATLASRLLPQMNMYFTMKGKICDFLNFMLPRWSKTSVNLESEYASEGDPGGGDSRRPIQWRFCGPFWIIVALGSIGAITLVENHLATDCFYPTTYSLSWLDIEVDDTDSSCKSGILHPFDSGCDCNMVKAEIMHESDLRKIQSFDNAQSIYIHSRNPEFMLFRDLPDLPVGLEIGNKRTQYVEILKLEMHMKVNIHSNLKYAEFTNLQQLTLNIEDASSLVQLRIRYIHYLEVRWDKFCETATSLAVLKIRDILRMSELNSCILRLPSMRSLTINELYEIDEDKWRQENITSTLQYLSVALLTYPVYGDFSNLKRFNAVGSVTCDQYVIPEVQEACTNECYSKCKYDPLHELGDYSCGNCNIEECQYDMGDCPAPTYSVDSIQCSEEYVRSIGCDCHYKIAFDHSCNVGSDFKFCDLKCNTTACGYDDGYCVTRCPAFCAHCDDVHATIDKDGDNKFSLEELLTHYYAMYLQNPICGHVDTFSQQMRKLGDGPWSFEEILFLFTDELPLGIFTNNETRYATGIQACIPEVCSHRASETNPDKYPDCWRPIYNNLTLEKLCSL